MLLPAQLILASLLVAAASAVVLMWLLLLTLSYGGQSGLMPWVAAGVILYGLAFNVAAAVVGVPGIFWANHLKPRASPKWARVAKAVVLIGTATLVLGFLVAVSVLVREQMRAKDPHNGCVSYRDAAASAALATSGVKPENDCPRRE
jgi:hypothetical protein